MVPAANEYISCSVPSSHRSYVVLFKVKKYDRSGLLWTEKYRAALRVNRTLRRFFTVQNLTKFSYYQQSLLQQGVYTISCIPDFCLIYTTLHPARPSETGTLTLGCVLRAADFPQEPVQNEHSSFTVGSTANRDMCPWRFVDEFQMHRSPNAFISAAFRSTAQAGKSLILLLCRRILVAVPGSVSKFGTSPASDGVVCIVGRLVVLTFLFSNFWNGQGQVTHSKFTITHVFE